MSLFTISSAQTKYFLVSDGQEQAGEKVRTVPENERTSDTFIHITPPEDPVTKSTVQGKTGLYVAIYGDNLVWSKERFEWLFYRIPDDGSYQIAAFGQDLYWFDKFGIGRTFIVKPGRDAVEKEIEFNVVRVVF